MFDCKLNDNYKKALTWTPEKDQAKAAEPTLEQKWKAIANRWGLEVAYLKHNYDAAWAKNYWKNMDNGFDDDDDDDYYDEGNMNCCGLEELQFHGLSEKVDKDTPENRNLLAKRINKYYNNDMRILVTGLPVRKQGDGATEYIFKNYKVIRDILLDFGFQKLSQRTYVNSNSSNHLCVLAGQFPE